MRAAPAAASIERALRKVVRARAHREPHRSAKVKHKRRAALGPTCYAHGARLKMPNPERFGRNTARTQYVELDRQGATVACLRVDDKMRWCHDHIAMLATMTGIGRGR